MDPSKQQTTASQGSLPDGTSATTQTRKIAKHRRANSAFATRVPVSQTDMSSFPGFELAETPVTEASSAKKKGHKREHSLYNPYGDDTKKGKNDSEEIDANEHGQYATTGRSTENIIGSRFQGSPEPEEEDVKSDASDFDYDKKETDPNYQTVKAVDLTDDQAVHEAFKWHNAGKPEKPIPIPAPLQHYKNDATEDDDLAAGMSGLGSTKGPSSAPGGGGAMTEDQK